MATSEVLLWPALAAYAVAALLLLLRTRRAGWGMLIVAGGLCAAAWVLRWTEVGHVPLQNLYEVWLAMGAAILAITLLCRVGLGVGGEWGDAAVGAVVLVPVVFRFFSPAPQRLPPALQSPLFVPHVGVYVLAYVLLAKASFQAVAHVLSGPTPADPAVVGYETGTHRMVLAGFPLLTVGLVLGAWWGRLAWDDWWHWDPKELWSFVSWLVFLAYLHFRGAYGRRYPRAASALVLVGAICILVTLLWVNLAKIFQGLHSYA